MRLIGIITTIFSIAALLIVLNIDTSAVTSSGERVNNIGLMSQKNNLIIVSGIFSFLINNLFLKFVKTLGIRNQDDTVIRWGSQSKPAVGGFSFYIIFLL